MGVTTLAHTQKLDRTFQNTGVERPTFINKHRCIDAYSLPLCCAL